MANPKGIVTRKDMFSDDAMNFGDPLVAEFTKVTKANDTLLSSVIQLNKEIKNLKVSQTEKDYITAKQAATLETQKAIDAIKIEKNSIIALEQQKRATIATMEAERKARQSSIESINKENTTKQKAAKLTIEERILLQANNRELRYAAMERLGLISAYTKLNKSRTDAKKRLLDLIATERSSTSEIKKAQREYDILDKKVRRADDAVRDFTKNVGNYKSAFSGFAGGIGNLLGAFGIIGGLSLFATIAKDIYTTTKEMQSLNNALKQVTDTNENLIEQQTFLTRISEAYGVELMGLTKQYTQFYVAAKDKLASSEIQGIFESITKAGASMGLSVQSQERAFLALNQMMSKGTIQAEELRGQLGEALPGALGIMAKSLNVSEKQLGDMMQNGELLAAEVLPKFAKQLEITYGIENKNRIDSIAASQNRLSNAWLEFIVSLNDRNALGSALKAITDELTATVDGWRKIFTSNEKLKENEMKTIRKQGFDSIKTSYSEQNKLTEAQLNVIKNLNSIEIKENAKKVNALIADNARLSKDRGLTGVIKIDSFDKILENRKKITELNRLSSALIGKNEGINALNKSRNTPAAADLATETEAERKARLAAEKKAAQDRLDLQKKLANSLYELQKQRLEQTIKFNDEIVADETETDEIRLQALSNSQKKQAELLLLTKKHLLTDDKLTANDRIRINEDYSNKIIDLSNKTQKEIDKIQLFDEAKYTKDLADKISKQNEAMNAELEAENRKFLALGDLEKLTLKERESAIEAHEMRVFDIKKRYAIEALKLQIANLESELIASDALPQKEQLTAEKRQQIAEALSKAKLDLSEVELRNNDDKNKKTVENEKLTAEIILQISQDLTSSLSNLANAIFATKIQNIDYEIDKNNEFYDKEIEAAGNNEQKKTLLEEERARKDKKLQDEKRKEQRKQAIFDKAAAVAQAGISAALAVLNALNTKPFLPLGPIMAGVAGALGAIQVAAILATPLPKYKLGRKGGPAQWAETGDGFVNEIVEKEDGRIYMTPNVPTLTYLEKGDNVHSSVDEYLKLQKAAMMSSIDMQGRKVSDFQATQYFDNAYSKELLEELKETTKAVKNNKNRTVINMPKLDINYHLWKMKNTNWN